MDPTLFPSGRVIMDCGYVDDAFIVYINLSGPFDGCCVNISRLHVALYFPLYAWRMEFSPNGAGSCVD